MRALPVFLFCLLIFCYTTEANDRTDSTYIRKFTDHFAIAGIIKEKRFDFTLRSRTGAGNFRRDFRPNNAYSAGIGLFLFDVNVELTAGIPFSERNTERYGITDTRDLQMNIITHKIGVELYHQRYNGFYVVDPAVSIAPGDPYLQRSDLSSRNTGYSMVYVFNPTKYSLPATYTYAEQQLRSQGSFLIQSSLSSWSIGADTALVGRDVRASFGTGASLINANFTSLDLGPGYAYNFIYRGFFLNLSLFLAPSHTWLRYQEVNQPERYDIQINLSSGARAAVGYNSDKFYTGLSLTNQSKVIQFTETELINN
ncbi:MAG TPA: DUF4421 family protein, partial [Cyclobacteriaceae bacterium]|nr:DUF4421 family protein [Cyclobacteriaceae bacterium]